MADFLTKITQRMSGRRIGERRLRRACLKFLFLFFGIYVFLTGAESYAANVETKSDLYLYLERLSAYGLIDSAILGARPIDRREFARLTIEASKKFEVQATPNLLPQTPRFILEKLKEEFREEIAEIGYKVSYIKPIRRVNLKYSHFKGVPSTFPGIKASQEPFNYNNEGTALNKDNLFVELEGDARYDSLSFYINPLLTSNLESKTYKLNKVYGKFYIGRFSVTVGKDSLWWGQGRHGSLILTNNAEPFKLFKISNEVPFNLPILGLFRMDFFLTKLEDDRDYPKPYFGGLRLSFKPSPCLEFGPTRTAITGGRGMPGLGLSDIGTILIGRNLEGRVRGESNQIAGVDARIRITPLKAHIYGEAAGEDEAGMLPSKWAYIAGIYFADIFGADLRVEYANTAFQYAGWYTHGVYTSGYTYKGRLIGHHMGGDAQDIFVGSSLFLNRNTKVSLSYNCEKRGVSRLSPESHDKVLFGLRQRVSKGITLNLKGGYGKVKNFEYTSGQDRENKLIGFSLELMM